MKKSWKYKVAKATAGNYKLNKKILRLKASWDEVNAILNGAVNKKKKRKQKARLENSRGMV